MADYNSEFTGVQIDAGITAANTALQPNDIANMLESDATGITGASVVTNVVAISQTDYNNLTPDASTFYIITG